MNIKRMSLGELGTNCYVVYDENNNALIFDPGSEPEKIINFIQNENLTPHAILLTHAHFDHIGAVDTIRKHFNIDVYLHEDEKDWLTDPNLNRSAISMRKPIITSEPDHLLNSGKMELSTFSFDVIHTPGHSPGSVTFIFSEYAFIISGDVLFQQGVGRTDLPGGSMAQLEHSIRKKLYQLPDSFQVFPGHSGPTTIGMEKKYNLYVPEIG